MASNVNFTEEEFKKMNEENKFYDGHLQQFHRKILEKIQDKSMFLACHILDKGGKNQVLETLTNNFQNS